MTTDSIGVDVEGVSKRYAHRVKGEVYAARDVSSGESVAIKLLLRLGPTEIYRFKREFRALSELHHPHLVQLHELFSEEGEWFFSMQLIEGCEWDQYVRPDERLNLDRLQHTWSQLVEALRFIHDAGKLRDYHG